LNVSVAQLQLKAVESRSAFKSCPACPLWVRSGHSAAQPIESAWPPTADIGRL